MKKLQNIAVLVILAAAAVWWLKPDGKDAEVKNRRDPAGVIVAFGDSLTRGDTAAPGLPWPALVQEGLPGSRVVNLGRNGETTASALDRIDKVLEVKPAVVIVTLGGNDLIQRITLGETRANLIRIFQTLQEAGVMVFYTSIAPPAVGDNWTMALEQLTGEEGVALIPTIIAGIWGEPGLMADRIHPNDAGHRKIAAKVIGRLEDFSSP